MGLVRGHYVHTQDLLELDSHRPSLPVHWCSRGPSPLRLDHLHMYLCRYPDAGFASYLAHGLSGGFRLGFSRVAPLRSVYRNHPSSTHNPQTITDYLWSEADAGRMVGPLLPSVMPLVQVSPMGLVP